MGWLRKKAKQIGKGIKKIGKGLKKVMGKIMKPFAKLGIVGQIALGMIMPWAAGAIWQGLTGTAFSLGSFGTVADNLAQSSNLFAHAAGRVMQGVHWGATTIQGAYNTVTEGLKTGFTKFTNKAKEVLGINADASDLIKQSTDFAEIDFTNPSAKALQDKGLGTIEGQLSKAFDVQQTPVSDFNLNFETYDFANSSAKALQDKGLGTIEGQIADKLGTKVASKKSKQTLLQKTVDKIKEKTIDFKNDAVSQLGTSMLTKIDTAINPTVEYEQGSNEVLTDFLGMGADNAYTKYNEVDISRITAYDNSLASNGGIYANMNHTIQANTSFGSDVWWKYLQGNK